MELELEVLELKLEVLELEVLEVLELFPCPCPSVPWTPFLLLWPSYCLEDQPRAPWVLGSLDFWEDSLEVSLEGQDEGQYEGQDEGQDEGHGEYQLW